MEIIKGEVKEAVDIMQEVAIWLKNIQQPLWELNELTEANLLKNNNPSDFYVGWVEDNSVAAMIFNEVTPFYWPENF